MSTTSKKGLLRQEGGVVYVEYLIAVMPLFTMFLCMVQLALMAESAILLHHAVNRAARSAIVVIREPANFVGADNGQRPSNDNYADASTLDDLRKPTLQFMKGLEYDGIFEGGASGYGSSASGPGRLFTIRAAAQMKMVSVAPHMKDLHAADAGGSSIKFAIGNGQSLDDAASAGRYVRSALGVDVTGPIDGSWDGNASSVSIRAEYLFPCMVPVAQTMLCHGGSLSAPAEGTEDVAGMQGGFVRVMVAESGSVPVAPQIYMPGEDHR